MYSEAGMQTVPDIKVQPLYRSDGVNKSYVLEEIVGSIRRKLNEILEEMLPGDIFPKESERVICDTVFGDNLHLAMESGMAKLSLEESSEKISQIEMYITYFYIQHFVRVFEDHILKRESEISDLVRTNADGTNIISNKEKQKSELKAKLDFLNGADLSALTYAEINARRKKVIDPLNQEIGRLESELIKLKKRVSLQSDFSSASSELENISGILEGLDRLNIDQTALENVLKQYNTFFGRYKVDGSLALSSLVPSELSDVSYFTERVKGTLVSGVSVDLEEHITQPSVIGETKIPSDGATRNTRDRIRQSINNTAQVRPVPRKFSPTHLGIIATTIGSIGILVGPFVTQGKHQQQPVQEQEIVKYTPERTKPFSRVSNSYHIPTSQDRFIVKKDYSSLIDVFDEVKKDPRFAYLRKSPYFMQLDTNIRSGVLSGNIDEADFHFVNTRIILPLNTGLGFIQSTEGI